jgi:prophage regulatory protein
MSDRLVRLAEILARTGLSRSSLYRLESLGLFPRRLKLGQRSVAWRETQLQAWIESRTEAPVRTSEAA